MAHLKKVSWKNFDVSDWKANGSSVAGSWPFINLDDLRNPHPKGVVMWTGKAGPGWVWPGRPPSWGFAPFVVILDVK